VSKLAVDSAGRVLVAGDFSTYNGQFGYSGNGVPGFVRVLPTGAFDFDFAPVGGDYARLAGSAPLVIAAGPGDSVYVGGYLADVAAARGGITRVAANGVRDTGFNVGNGLQQQAFVDVRGGSAGRYYLFGLFDYVDGAMRPNVARMLTTGRVDTTFDPRPSWGSAYINNSVRTVHELADGQVWVFGPFTRFGDLARSGGAAPQRDRRSANRSDGRRVAGERRGSSPGGRRRGRSPVGCWQFHAGARHGARRRGAVDGWGQRRLGARYRVCAR
jgi:hypothetical protein